MWSSGLWAVPLLDGCDFPKIPCDVQVKNEEVIVRMCSKALGVKVAVRQVGRADQSKVTETQITSKDFPKRGHACIEQEVEAEQRGCSKVTGAGI